MRIHHPDDLRGFKRQTCRVCKYEDKFNFNIPDAMWKKVVPRQYQNTVVCLSCFDDFAREKHVDYSDSIDVLYFAGDQASLKFQPVTSHNVL